ncbi:MAG: hypothetical protein ABEK17_03820 [Candidatus Aenigmatarchaeota archaeon]
MRVYEPRCKVCNLSNRTEVEEMRLEKNATLKEIKKKIERDKGKKITIQAISRHFKKHVMDNYKEAKKSKLQTEEIASKEIDETLNIVDELRGSIGILKKMLNRILEEKEDEISSSQVNAITKCLTEIRLTVKELNNLTGSLEISNVREGDVKDEFFSKFMDKVDSSVAQEVLRAWDKTEEEMDESE